MDEALYYTLSTIPQTLAAGLGVLGVFLLFRVEAWDYDIERARRKLSLHFPHDADELLECLEAGDIIAFRDGYFERKREYPNAFPKDDDDILEAATLLARTWPARRSLVKSATRAMYWTGGALAVSLGLLPATPLISNNIYITATVLIGTVALALIAFYRLLATVLFTLPGRSTSSDLWDRRRGC